MATGLNPVPAPRARWRPWLAALLLTAFLVLALCVAATAWVFTDLLGGTGPSVTLQVDGETVRLGPLAGLHGFGVLAALMVALAAVLVVLLVVVPLVVLAALLAAALATGFALLAALGSVALALSPLLLPLLLLWWLLRRRPAPLPAAAPGRP